MVPHSSIQQGQITFCYAQTPDIILITGVYFKSRSEKAPGSEFHPRDKSENNDFGFLGPSWCNKKLNPETYVHVVHMNYC